MAASDDTRPLGESSARARHDRPRAGKARLRSCVACREQASPAELTRWIWAGDGSVLPDLGQTAFGRGAWLHPSAACLKKAANGFSRTFKAPVHLSVTELAELLSSAAERRILALLGIARRSQKLASGTSAVDAELSAGRCHLVVVATDAQSAARATQVQRAVAQGNAVAWGTKAVLGGLAGRTEAGVVAVMDDGLANALKATIAMAQSARAAGTEVAPGPARDRVLQWKAETESSTEVG